MKMEPLNSGDFRVWMTAGDMRRWGLNIDLMQTDTQNTTRVLRRLLGIVRQRSAFASVGSVVVEALPLDDGCVLLFSRCGSHGKATGPFIVQFESADTLLRFAEALAARHGAATLPYASLYRQDKRYMLIVYTSRADVKRVYTVAKEFGCAFASGEIAVSSVEEHATVVAVGDVLNRLCEAYGSRSPMRQHRVR